MSATKSTICFKMKDANGGVYGILSIDRSKVMEAVYITTKGVLQLVLASKHLEGKDELLWHPVQRGKLNTTTNQVETSNTGAIREDKFFKINETHNTVEFTEEDEIREIWDWLDNGMTSDDLFAVRDKALQDLEDFKQKKLKEQKDNEAAELAKLTEGENPNMEFPQWSEEVGPDEMLNAAKEKDQQLIADLKSGKTGSKKKPLLKKV